VSPTPEPINREGAGATDVLEPWPLALDLHPMTGHPETLGLALPLQGDLLGLDVEELPHE
jgi:hypothetical protein